jgi:Flp pilus assembly protein TadG
VTIKRRTERGLALVEFALLLPFLAMLTLTTIDLGRAYTLQHKLANAAREGAAFAQYFPGRVTNTGSSLCTDPNNIRYHVNGENTSASAFTLTVTNMTSSAVVSGCTGEGLTTSIAPGSRLRIQTQASFTPLTPFAKAFVGNTPTLTRKTDVIVQGKT